MQIVHVWYLQHICLKYVETCYKNARALFHSVREDSSSCRMKNLNHKKRGTQSGTLLGMSHQCEHCAGVHPACPFLNRSFHIVVMGSYSAGLQSAFFIYFG